MLVKTVNVISEDRRLFNDRDRRLFNDRY